MAALQNPRHERFAIEIATGNNVTQSDAYKRAGYKTTKPDCVYVSASRLLRHVKVKDRITELQERQMAMAAVTRESITAELDEARELARKLEQPSVMRASSETKAKLHGLMVEHVEQKVTSDHDMVADEYAANLLERLEELESMVEKEGESEH